MHINIDFNLQAYIMQKKHLERSIFFYLRNNFVQVFNDPFKKKTNEGTWDFFNPIGIPAVYKAHFFY